MKYMVIENIAIYASIAICTTTVAYFAQSGAGLWSLFMLLWANSIYPRYG